MKNYLRLTLVLFFLVSIIMSTDAQQIFPGNCATDELQEKLRISHPDRRIKEQQINQLIYENSINGNVSRGGILTIPVVVHIIHMNGEENISNEMVLQGIGHLNQAFSNSGSYQHENGVNTHIQFCIALQDPIGLPTNGITRHVSPLTNVNSDLQDADLKSIVLWDPTQYLNIWLVNEITTVSMGSGVAGYAYFPSSHGAPNDGIVNEARWFGSSVDNSKIHIHEAGHYLGLYHTFNGACVNNDCFADGDRVCDTPPDASTDIVPCNSFANTCTTDSDDPSTNNPFRAVTLGGSGDSPDLSVNYMDYNFQHCQIALTQGQSDRMNFMLNSPRASLLESEGCNNACGVYVSGFNYQDLDLPSFGQIEVMPYIESVVPHHFEWIINGEVVSTESTYTFTPTGTGNVSISFRIYNTLLACYSEQTLHVHVFCGTQTGVPAFLPLNPDPGDAVIFSGTPNGGTITSAWYVNGISAGNQTDLTYTFASAGENVVSYITTDGFCFDTSYVYVPVGSCNRGEALRWWVNFNHVLSFYGDEPVRESIPDSVGFAGEGISNICDVNGNLILATEGTRISGGDGNLIENGDSLNGGQSSSQAALIVPNPSYNNIYYVFTTDHFGGVYFNSGGALSYSVVDLSLNGGHGAVTQKNVFLMTATTEKQSAVKHCNGHDIWHVSHQYGSNAFYAYLVTDDGVSAVPIISNVGTSLGPADQGSSALGCMKISPQGDKLAFTVHPISNLGNLPAYSELFDFDNATGLVSNPIHIPADVYPSPYGVEFSPDGTKLYIGNTSQHGYTQSEIFQYDLNSGNASEIVASRALIGTSSTIYMGIGSLQLAKNGRIYVARVAGQYLDEITYPNLPGTACQFVDKKINSGHVSHGLPNMVSSFAADLTPDIHGPAQLCANTTASYSIVCGHPGNTEWTFNGPGTFQIIDNNHVSVQAGTSFGTGELVVSRDAGCLGLLYDTLFIRIGVPQPFLGTDTAVCTTAQVNLSPGAGYNSYLWQNGTSMSYFNAPGAGTYWVQVAGEGGCTARDTIVISDFNEEVSVSLGNDTSYCLYQSMTITPAPQDFLHYQWSNGQTTPTATTGGFNGTLILAATSINGCIARDTVVISLNIDNPVFQFDNPTYYCPGRVVVLETGLPNLQHHWQDHSELPEFTAWQPGLYWTTVTTACGDSWTDTVNVIEGLNPVVFLGADTFVCPFIPYSIAAGGNENTYLWHDGTQLPTHVISEEGIYSVVVTSASGCTATDSIDVKVCPLGIDENSSEINIYPNPAYGYFDISSSQQGGAEITIYNSAGALVFKEMRVFPEAGSVRVASDNFAAGIYAVRIISEGKSVILRLVIGK